MDEKRPIGREKNVTGKGKGLGRRGEGLGTGPVGSSDGYADRREQAGGASSGPQRSTRGGGLGLIGILLVLLLGGGGGLGGLLFGGGSGGSTTTVQQPVYTPQPAQTTPQSSAGSAQSYGTTGFDLSQLSQLFGTGATQTLTGTQSAWGGGSANTGSLDTSVAPGSRNKYTQILGNGQDIVTVMVYMCGADLESRNGMATSDLSEMVKAQIGDNVNVLVYTGGATSWRNRAVSSRVNQVYKVVSGGVERIVEDDGNKAMTDPNTLATFIKWCSIKYPANRNALILWDHGSGSLAGYGHDEKHPRNGSMSLHGINQALTNAGVKFDMIGFDTCLMATAENALMLSKHADYLVASEETEPGTGWYYTNWLTELSRNTSLPTTQIGKRIIDDFVDVSAQRARGQSTTLSLVDLAELSNTLPASLAAFSESTGQLLETSQYKQVSQARSSTREYAKNTMIDQVDLAHLAMNMGTTEGQELAQTVRSAVKYNRTSPNMTNSYGLSIYFPYQRLSNVDNMVRINQAIGMDSSYSRVIQQFASVGAAGQGVFGQSYGGGGNPFPMLSGSGSYSSGGASEDILSQLLGSMLSGSMGVSGLTADNASFFTGRSIPEEVILDTLEQDHFDPTALVWTQQEDGTHTLSLSQEQWGMVTALDLNVFYDDGEGFIDLGLDNTYRFTEEGALIGETDGTWLAINGQEVPYYHIYTTEEEDGGYTITGRVPVLLNGERADLLLVFTDEDPYGYVAGALTDYRDGDTETVAKVMAGISEAGDDWELTEEPFLKDGDTIDFLCDYYSYDGTYQDSYMVGEQLVVDGELEISNVELDGGTLQVTYRFTDIYGGKYWTPALSQ